MVGSSIQDFNKICASYRHNRIAMEVNRTVTIYGVKSSSFSKVSVCEEDSDHDSATLRVVQDEDQNISTQNMDGEPNANVRHGETKGLFSCLDGILHFFRQIFPFQDADGDDDKDPLLENHNLQGQGQVENRSIDLGAVQNGSTAGGTQSFTAAAFRRPRGPKSPVPNPGSGAQHN